VADVPKEISAFFRKLAEKGDYPHKGGVARAKALTKAQRSKIAKKAAKARWKKKPKKS
jgi:F0F1-type ATP synthase delta subunit